MKTSATLSPCLIVLIFCLCPIRTFSQITIQGSLTEAGEALPLAGATVLIRGSAEGTVTDADGRFQLQTRQSLPLVLEISHLGYAIKTITVHDAGRPLRVELEKSPWTINQVVVTASRQAEKATSAPAAISVVEARRLQSDVVSHPVMSLRNLPGVEIQEHGIGRYHVGLRNRRTPVEASETFVLVDNRQLIQPGISFVPFGSSPVDPIDLDRVEVVRGPGSALYGPGVEGGVVHFISKNPFTSPGTTVSLTGGARSSFGLSARQAGIIGKNLGYKVLGIYNLADNWPLDPNDSTDAVLLAMFQDTIRSTLTGDILEVHPDDRQVERLNLSALLEYRFGDQAHLSAAGGYAYVTNRDMILFYEKETRTPYTFGQLKYQSPRFFGQVYATHVANKEKSFKFDSGTTDYIVATNLEAQAQYRSSELAGKRLSVIAGADYRTTFVDTKGILSGRNEGSDDYRILGVYAQARWAFSPRFQAVAAGRLDYFASVSETAFSPRLALLYQPAPAHALRLTYNRAFGIFGALENYFDYLLAPTPLFDVRLWGTAMRFTYPDLTHMTSYFGLPASDALGISLPAAYPIVLGGLAAEGALPADLAAYLGSLASAIDGFSQGILSLNGRPVDKIYTRSAAGKVTRTDQIELGYQGVLADKLAIVANLYLNGRRNFISTPIRVNPVVNVPSLGDDLAAAVLPAIDPAKLPPGYTAEQVAGIIRVAGAGLGNSPIGVGVIEPDGARSVGRPDLLLTFVNFGKISYWGAELGFTWSFSDDFSAFANYTWLSQQFFDENDLDEQGTGFSYALNQPVHRARMGFSYLPPAGIRADIALRYDDAFTAVASFWSGAVPALTLLDAGLGYQFPTGLRIDFSATNVLNTRYRVLPNMPRIGRMVLGRATYQF